MPPDDFDFICKICGFPVASSASEDTCGRCLGDIDEENRDPDHGTDDDDDHVEGCVFPGECCMPGPHLKSECHTAEMLMQQEYEAQIDGYKEQVEDLEDALKNIFNGTMINVDTAGERLLGMIVKLTHEYADKALEKSHQSRKARGIYVSENIGCVKAYTAADGSKYGFLPVSDESKE